MTTIAYAGDMNPTHSLQTVQAEVRKILVDFGADHMNPGADMGSCMYTNEYDEHCIAGQVAVNLGVSVPGMGDDENEKTLDDVGAFVENFTDEAIVFLYEAQKWADMGYNWGRAVEKATGGDRI